MKPDVTLMGHINTVDNPDAKGSNSEPQRHDNSIVIEFETPNELRAALEKGHVEFTVFGIDSETIK